MSGFATDIKLNSKCVFTPYAVYVHCIVSKIMVSTQYMLQQVQHGAVWIPDPLWLWLLTTSGGAMCSGLRQLAAMFVMSENYNITLNTEKYKPAQCLLLLGKKKKQAWALYTHGGSRLRHF